MASGVPISSLASGVEFISSPGVAVTLGAGRQVWVYKRNSTTPVAAYSDQALSIPLTQPLTTTSTGAVPGYIAGEQAIDIKDVVSGAVAQAEPLAVADLIGSDGTIGGPGSVGLPSAVALSTAAGAGALAATAGRTSTFAAPVLRDFVAVKDQGYNARGGAKVVATGGSATAGSTAYTDTTNAPFTTADTGKTVIIPGAGTGGRNFSTTITYVSASQVTLAVAAITTVAGGYQYGWDDTAAINTAMTNLGTGTLFFGNDTYLVSSLIPKPGITIWGYGTALWKLPGNPTTGLNSNAIIYARTTDTVTVNVGFRCYGMEFHGEGTANYVNGDLAQQDAIWLQQWSDTTIRDCKADGFIDSAFSHRSFQRARVIDNTVTNCSLNLGRNPISFADGNGTTGAAMDFTASGNTIQNCQAIGISLVSTGNTPPAQFRAIIVHNDIQMNSQTQCIAVEINAYNAGANSGFARQIIIANNVLTNTNSTNNSPTGCIFVQDDTSGTTTNDPTKAQDIIVAKNYCTSAAAATAGSGNGAIHIAASRFNVSDNTVVATGTNSRCLFHLPKTTDPTVYSGAVFSDNSFYATNTGGVNNVVDIQFLTHWSLLGGIVSSSSTTSGDGVRITASCQFWTIGGGLRIENAAANGLNLNGWKDGKIDGLTIYNPNAANSVSTSANNGIFMPTAANVAGTLNELLNTTIYDDRGTHQMGFGVQGPGSAATTKAICRGLTIRGALTLPMTATTIANTFSELTNYTSNVLTGYGLNTTGGTVGASPFTTTVQSYDQTFYLLSIGGTTAITESRNGQALPVAVGDIFIRRNESITITWATTAPTYTLQPVI